MPEAQVSLQFGAFPGAGVHQAILSPARVRKWVGMALQGPAEIGVRIVGAEEGQALNRQYRGKDYATNVLTFDYAREPVVSADLVLCAPVVEREAKEQGRRWRRITRTCWCTGRCTRRAMTTRRGSGRRWRWRRWRCC